MTYLIYLGANCIGDQEASSEDEAIALYAAARNVSESGLAAYETVNQPPPSALTDTPWYVRSNR